MAGVTFSFYSKILIKNNSASGKHHSCEGGALSKYAVESRLRSWSWSWSWSWTWSLPSHSPLLPDAHLGFHHLSLFVFFMIIFSCLFIPVNLFGARASPSAFSPSSASRSSPGLASPELRFYDYLYAFIFLSFVLLWSLRHLCCEPLLRQSASAQPCASARSDKHLYWIPW